MSLSVESAKLTRYQGLVVAIALFLLLICILMGTSVYLSGSISRNAGRHTAVSQLSDSYQTAVGSLNTIKFVKNDQTSAAARQALAANQENFSRIARVLHEGGEIQNAAGETLSVSALGGSEDIALLTAVEQKWAPLSDQISTYLKQPATSSEGNSHLDEVLLAAQSGDAVMRQSIIKLSDSLSAHISGSTGSLNWIMLFGIIAAPCCLALIMLRFVRKLQAADAKVEQAQQETDEIMGTVSSGLFLLDRDLNIGTQYSKELERLLGQSNFGGKNLLDVLGQMISDEDLNTAHGFIGLLYNPRTKEKLISSLNPLTRIPVYLSDKNGKRLHYLDFKFNRVYKDDAIVRVLVSVSDATSAVLLEQRIEKEREQNDTQLDMLSSLLQADNRQVRDFLRNIERHNNNINEILKKPGETQPELREKIQKIYREIHSLKGEASSLKLHNFIMLAEHLETELNKLASSSPLSGENFLGLAVHLEEMIKLTKTIEDLTARLARSGGGTDSKPAADNSQLTRYINFVADLAKRNGKAVGFSCSGIDETDDSATNSVIQEIVIQLLRNAVVHGIETPDERQRQRKIPTGHIHMQLTDSGSQYVLSLEDDGKGIDYEAIRKKAVKIGLYDAETAAGLGSKELLALIFSSGFSTLDKSNEDAGRGIGMDIIKDRITRLGGKINVASQPGRYTRFMFTIPK